MSNKRKLFGFLQEFTRVFMLKFKTNESQSEIDTNIFAWLCGMRKKVSFVICKHIGYKNKSDLFNMHAMSWTWSSLRRVEDRSKETRAVSVSQVKLSDLSCFMQL